MRPLAAAVVTLMAVTAGAQQPTAAATAAVFPAAATLIAKYAAAIGAPAIMKAPQITTKGALTMPAAGLTAAFEMVQVAPNKMQMMTTIPGVGAIQVGFDGTTGWSVDPMQGPAFSPARTSTRFVKGRSARDSRSRSCFSAVQTVADTTMGGEQCYMVKLTGKSGRETFDCYRVRRVWWSDRREAFSRTAMGAIPVVMTTATTRSSVTSDADQDGPVTMGQQQVTTIPA